MIWVDRKLALAIHDRQLTEHAGAQGIRDDGLLRLALARPQQLYAYGDPHPDVADLAASLAFGIARNHPFIDGNKRTAYVCCRTFLVLNGADMRASLTDKFIKMLEMAEGQLSETGYAQWIREHMVVEDKNQLHETAASY